MAHIPPAPDSEGLWQAVVQSVWGRLWMSWLSTHPFGSLQRTLFVPPSPGYVREICILQWHHPPPRSAGNRQADVPMIFKQRTLRHSDTRTVCVVQALRLQLPCLLAPVVGPSPRVRTEVLHRLNAALPRSVLRQSIYRCLGGKQGEWGCPPKLRLR